MSPGPVVSALANRFGCRPVSIVGRVIAGVFFTISQFSPNIDVLIFTYGVMGGQLLLLSADDDDDDDDDATRCWS